MRIRQHNGERTVAAQLVLPVHGKYSDLVGRTIAQSIVHGAVTSRHVARLFDSLKSRAEAVSSFVGDALADGEHVLLLAKASSWDAIAGQLLARECPVERAQQDGSLLVFDAKDALEAVSRDGFPAEDLFETVIGRQVARLTRQGRLSAYGEIVDLLAERGDFQAAICLEEFWNRLAERCSFTLLCGYSAAHFVGRNGDRALEGLCQVLGGMYPGGTDPLSQWLLGSTH